MQRPSGWLVLAVALALTPRAASNEQVLHVGWLLDGTGSPIRHGAYLTLRNGRIQSVSSNLPPGAGGRVLEFPHDTAIPGLVDAHGHIVLFGLDPDATNPLVDSSRREEWVLCNARTALASGVTTLRDPGTYDWVMRMRERIDRVGPRWIPAGRQMVKRAPDAYMDEMFVEFDGVEEARAVVRRLQQDGSQFIKLRLTKQRPLPSLDEVKAIVAEAHRLRLKVAAHTDVPHDEAIRLALEGGVDTLEHNAALRTKNRAATFAEIVRRDVVVVPGMANWQAQMDAVSIAPEDVIEEPLESELPPRLRELIVQHAREIRRRVEKMIATGLDPAVRRRQALEETRSAFNAGVRLATGPDSGSLLPHGRLYKDAYWLAEAGLPIEQVVRAATLNGAHAAGIDAETGSLEPGKLGDLLIVKGNLAEDYRRLKDVVLVIRGGRVVFDARQPYVPGCQ